MNLSQPPKRLRMGVIGAGAVAQIMHLPHLHKHDAIFEITGLADTHAPTLAAVAAHYHIPSTRAYLTAAELIAQPDIDAVGIFHNGSHAETAIAALRAGKHVLAEKPLGWNLSEVEAVARVAGESDRTFQMAYHKLYDPGFAYARDTVRAMKDIAEVRISILHPTDNLGWAQHRILRGNNTFMEGWRDPGTQAEQIAAQLEGMAGGALAPLVDAALGAKRGEPRLRLAYGILCSSIIHQIYTLHGFFGRLPERVIYTHVWREGLSIHVLAAYADGVHVTIDWQFLSHLKDYREEYLFLGNHDRVAFTLPSPYARNAPSPVIVQGHDGETTWEKHVIVSHEEAFERELIAFYDNTTHHKPPLSGIESALEHHRFIQAIIDAAK